MPSALLLLLACSAGPPATGSDSGPGADGDPADSGASDASDPGVGCPAAVEPAAAAVVTDAALTEVSGLALGGDGLLWAHNDSGDGPTIYALDTAGRLQGTVEIEDTSALDWEDLAAGTVDGAPALFLGDIGDNAAARVDVAVTVVTEPDPAAGSVPGQRHALTYEDGPRDAEALVFDPVDGGLFVLSKEASGAGLYAADLDAGTLVRVADLDLGAVDDVASVLVTAADLSPDGSCLYLRTYTDVVAWPRDRSRPLAEALAAEPVVLDAAAEAQGEALAADADGFWTLSEGTGETLYRHDPPADR